MLKVLEKPFGRTIKIALLETAKDQPTLGFETHTPLTTYCRLPYGKFSFRLEANEPVDLLIRLDNKLLLERRLEAGTHTLSRGNDNKPFCFLAPGEKPAFVADDAGSPLPVATVVESESNTGEAGMLADGIIFEQAPAAEPAAPARLFADADPPADAILAETYGLVVVQVRFAHVKPDFGPILPPDSFTVICYQLNEPGNHALALAKNFRKVIKPASPPPGTPDILDPANPTQVVPLPKRICCLACDRGEHHDH
ncbi:MAG: hypothetical protein K2W82_18035 [Candidatus Obscuribacterales bacterium]|nr:hypothetical protein [Candidatus Obscuribacterales bacterium]